jgi:hypothetical protein
MAKTRKLIKHRANKMKRSNKYNMKGCFRKNKSTKMNKCKICNRVHKGKHQKGGCACQFGGNSVGIFQNFSNIGQNFMNGVVGIYNGLNTLPQPVSPYPTQGHLDNK